MKLDDLRRGKMPAKPIVEEIEEIEESTEDFDPVTQAESDALWTRVAQNMPARILMSGEDPMRSTVAAAEMTRVFQTIKVGDVIQIGHREIEVTEQMWQDAKNCLSEVLSYQWASWVFPNVPEGNLTTITRVYLTSLFWRFYVDHLSDEPPGLGLFARLKYRLGL